MIVNYFIKASCSWWI